MVAPLHDIAACVFDAYGTLFDFNSAVAQHRDAVGPSADRLSELWRSKQLQYTWIRSLSGAYAPFRTVTRDALEHSMAALGLSDHAVADRLMDAYLALTPFPEVPAMLSALRSKGMRLGILSNGDHDMLAAAIRSAGLGDAFEAVDSAQSVGVFKTDPRVYELSLRSFAVRPERVCFLSSNCWDAHGAAHFGFRTLWINRGNAPDDRLPGAPHGVLPSLEALPGLLT